MNYEEINARFGFYASVNPEMKKEAARVEAWFDKQGFTFDEEEREELTALIYDYLANRRAKEVRSHTRSMFDRDYKEREKKAISYAQKLGVILTEALNTPKGRELSKMLFELIENPKDYITDTEMKHASLDSINSFFSKVSISKDSKKELFSILKK